jgi:hypothetical protein
MTVRQQIVRPQCTFPYPLPTVIPAWRTSTVVAITSGIAAEGAWDRLPILADALQEAGCDDAEILTHLRHCEHGKEKWPNRNGGCWEGTCWVIREIQQKSQKVVAVYANDGPAQLDLRAAPVVNPGNGFGEVYLVTPETWADGPVYAVEGQNHGEAEDEFIDSRYGEHFRISDNELKDYVTDSGSWGDNPQPPEYRCSFTDSGTPYDSEMIHVNDTEMARLLDTIRYVGPGIPPDGVKPTQFGRDQWECVICNKKFYLFDDTAEQVCSPKCEEANNKILTEMEQELGSV